ncbi:MAG: DUF2911 domain-containing protein [Chitinophagaceae bacterium]|nr:DUF2911 domain-containing protein [Chitinophagaceae bacterium]MCW5927328.1 DUF2911 domain-containing protein [Chitinophagaceae bacterium]
MKKILLLSLTTAVLSGSVLAQQGAPASPPASSSAKITSGATITISYSQPSVKGRTIGKDLEPMAGKVWRTGANKATVFETDQDVTVEGQPLPAGKYALFTIAGDDEWTIIFNKTADQWGAFQYDEKEDALRVKVKPGKAAAFAEKLRLNVAENGEVNILWGDSDVKFVVK